MNQPRYCPDCGVKLQEERCSLCGRRVETDEPGPCPVAEVVRMHGPVDMAEPWVPAGWIPFDTSREADGPRPSLPVTYRGARAPSNADIEVAYFYRGTPCDRHDVETFVRVIERGQTTLAPAEVRELGDLVRSLSDPAAFRVTAAWTTESCSGLTLCVEGVFIGSGLQVHHVFRRADPASSAIVESWYAAPAAEYDRHREVAFRAIHKGGNPEKPRR